MSIIDKAELNQSKNDGGSSENSPSSISERSSAISWQTPMSIRFSSSSSWNTSKLSKSSGDSDQLMSDPEEVITEDVISVRLTSEEVINETGRVTTEDENRNETTAIGSPCTVSDDDPPPYSQVPNSSGSSPFTSIENGLRAQSLTSQQVFPELTNLISSQAVSISPARISRWSERTLGLRPSMSISFRDYPDEHPGSVKDRDTFAQKYGTVCIVAFLMAFLMILSLIAKFLIKKTLQP